MCFLFAGNWLAVPSPLDSGNVHHFMKSIKHSYIFHETFIHILLKQIFSFKNKIHEY